MAPSIQTAPLGFKPNVTGPGRRRRYTEHVLRVVAHLVELEQRTGATVTLGARARAALLSRDDRRDGRLLHGPSLHGRGRRAPRRRSPASRCDTAIGALRRHLGVVFDIGHQAVGFEDIPVSLQKLVDAGIPIVKLQEAAAM